MDIEASDRREKMLKLRDELIAVENDRLQGRNGCTLDELDSYLNSVIAEAKKMFSMKKSAQWLSKYKHHIKIIHHSGCPAGGGHFFLQKRGFCIPKP